MTRTGGCRREQMQALAGGESAVGRKQSSGVSCAGHGVSPWHVSSTAPVQCTARHAGDGVQRLDDATGASNCEAAAGNRRHDSPGGGQRQRQLTRRSRDSSLKRMHAYASRVQQDSSGGVQKWRRLLQSLATRRDTHRPPSWTAPRHFRGLWTVAPRRQLGRLRPSGQPQRRRWLCCRRSARSGCSPARRPPRCGQCCRA